MNALHDVLTLFQNAFAASILVALACALIGVHVVARRLIVTGVALPQMAALGIAFSFLLLGTAAAGGAEDGWQHEGMALLLELVAVGILAAGGRRRLLGNDAIAGVMFVAGGALTILVMMGTARGLDEVKNLVEGNILTVGASELRRLVTALGPVVLLLLLFSRGLLLTTFDRETAATLGVRTGLYEALFFGGLAVVVAAGVHSTGTLFVFGFLVLPGATGLTVGRSAVTVTAVAAVSAMLAAAMGFFLSYVWDAPTGPMCVATMLSVFLVCTAFSFGWRQVLSRSESRRAAAASPGLPA